MYVVALFAGLLPQEWFRTLIFIIGFVLVGTVATLLNTVLSVLTSVWSVSPEILTIACASTAVYKCMISCVVPKKVV